MPKVMASPSPLRAGIEPPRLSSNQLWCWLVFLMALTLAVMLFYVAAHTRPPLELPSTRTVITLQV